MKKKIYFSIFFLISISVKSQNIPVVQTLTGAATIACPQDNTLTLQSSETNFNYFLRNDADKSIIGNSQTGTGSALNFQTGVITETKNYHTFAANKSYSLDFDGINDYVEIPHHSILQPTSQISIEAWVRVIDLTASSGLQEIYRKENTGIGRFLLSFQNNGTILAFGLDTSNGGYQELDVPINKADYENEWVHILATYDTANMKLYKDGVLIGTLSKTGNITNPATPSAAYIGSFSGISEFLLGKVAAVRVWHKALVTQTEIQQAKDNLFVGNEYSLAAYYPFFENSGTSLSDETLINNNGTINGATWATGTTGGIGKIASNIQTITYNPPFLIYVDATATGTNCGDSWANAFTSIQFAVNVVPSGGTVHIAEGTYKEGAEILINKPITIKGGYRTGGGTQNIAENPTILDGEHTGGTTGYRVLKYTSTGNLNISGITIQNGYNTDVNSGAGISATTNGGHLFLEDCKIINNVAVGKGGGIYNFTNLTITDCLIANNSAAIGGGIYSERDLIVRNISVVKNTAITNAGGVYHILSANYSIDNSIIALNTAPTNSQVDFNPQGVVNTYNYTFIQGKNYGGTGNINDVSETFDPMFVDATNNDFNLQNNSSLVNAGNPSENRGATDKDANGNARTVFCRIDIGALENGIQRTATTIYVDKTATGSNNGTSWANAYTTLTAAISFGGTCIADDVILIAAGTYQENEYVMQVPKTIKGGYPAGGGLQDIKNNLTILDGSLSHIVVNVTQTSGTLFLEGLIIQNGVNTSSGGGGIKSSGNLNLNFVKVINNSAGFSGGGIFAYNGSVITLTNSLVSNNATSNSIQAFGGGIFIINSTVKLINCQVVNNSSSSSSVSFGGGIAESNGTITLINSQVIGNTITSTSTFSKGGGTYGNTILQNSILWNNTKSIDSGTNFTPNEHEFGSLTTNYSLIKNQNPTGTNNIDATIGGFNPLFVNEAGGDFRLQTGSPLINAGLDTYNTTLADLDNNARKVGAIDIGAYEFNNATNANTSWTGNTNTLWQEPTNWNNGLPDVNSNVTIPTGLGNYPTVTNTNNAIAFNIENQTGSSININAGKGLTIGNNLTNNGTITINSDVNSSGSLQVKGNASGNITYNRYVTDNWHTVGAPVVGQTIQQVAENNQVIKNGDNSKYAIAPYNNDVFTNNWEYVLVADVANVGNFTNGKGYSMKRASSGIYSFTGSIGNNNKTVTLTDGSKNNWNLIANPYPNFLKFNNLADASSNLLLQNVAQLNTNNLAIYIWDTLTTTYKPYNHASTNLQYIAPGQAFFVNTKTGGSTFTFNKNLQTHHTGTVFARNTNSTFEINLNVSFRAQSRNLTKSTEIKYLSNTTKGLDAGYDAETFTAQDNSFSVYTHLLENNENKAFALQCLPPIDFENKIIPIGINADANITINFIVDATNIPTGIHIYLEDKLENTFTKLNDDGSYEITLLEAQNGVGRFYVHTTSQVLNTADLSTTIEQTKIWLSENRTLIISNVSSEKATITLYGLLGKKVFTKQLISLTQSKNLEIQLPNTLSKATYIVRLKTKNGVKTTKILIK